MSAKPKAVEPQLTLVPEPAIVPSPAPPFVVQQIEQIAAEVSDQIAILSHWAEYLVPAADADLPRFHELAQSVKAEQSAALTEIMNACKREVMRRIVARGAREIPDKDFTIALDEQYAPYAFDLELLKEAAALLPDDEAAIVVKHFPELVEITPERWDPGNPVSINALRKKYAGSTVGDILNLAMTRDTLEPKVIIKPRKTIAAVKNVTRSGGK